MNPMDSVTLTDGHNTVVFSSAKRKLSDHPYAGESFVVELNGDGLRINRDVFIFGDQWESLAEYFENLAVNWRGWNNTKTWQSIEGDLRIDATYEQLGHCLLTFDVNGPNQSWRTTLNGFIIAAGEDMNTAAQSVRAWIDG